MTPNNGWDKYQKLVLQDLTELKSCVKSIQIEVNSIRTEVRTEIAMLKVKSGVWGAAAGILIVATALLVQSIGRN